MDARREELKKYTHLAVEGEKLRKAAVKELDKFTNAFIAKHNITYTNRKTINGAKYYFSTDAGGELNLNKNMDYGSVSYWQKHRNELPVEIQDLLEEYVKESQDLHAKKAEALKVRLDARHKRDDLRAILTAADKETCVKLGYSISSYGKDYFGIDLPNNIHVVFEYGQIARIYWCHSWFTLKQMLKYFQSQGCDENYNNLKTLAENF